MINCDITRQKPQCITVYFFNIFLFVSIIFRSKAPKRAEETGGEDREEIKWKGRKLTERKKAWEGVLIVVH